MTHPRLLRYAGRSPAALNTNKAHTIAASHALMHFASHSVYSFIPKNACSTMRLTLAMANGCLASEKDFPWIHLNNETFRASLRDLATAEYTFAILRCPYRRLASAFLDKIVSRSSDFWHLYHTCGDQLDPAGLSFRGFVDALTPAGRLTTNIHWRPQKDFLVYERYDDLFRMERFDEIAPRLKARIGLTLVDARAHLRHGTDGLVKVTGTGFADTPCRDLLDLRAEGKVPDYAALYDESLIERVAALYRKDINFYRAFFGTEDLLFDLDPNTMEQRPD